MKNDNVIEVNNVSKVFSRNYKSARVQLINILKESFMGCHDKTSLQKDEFWAIKNLSFCVKKNEKLAILGPNGSGKSTLLKMLNGIYLPNDGTIEVDGVISSVLELSSGFKSDLSGYENIYLKFALLEKKGKRSTKLLMK
jgi:lipopolysaccharide transport system ATP-binding protein